MFRRKILESPKGRAAMTFAENLSSRDLLLFLLQLSENRANRTNPTNILRNYGSDRFCAISPVPQSRLRELDRLIYGILPDDFEAVELSPVSPIGINCALSAINPKVILQTIRTLEVNADPTTALAIECARRKRVSPKIGDLHLATSHRSLRLQVFDEEGGFTPHFRTFCLASSGRNQGRGNFVGETLEKHLKFWLDCLMRANELDFHPSEIKVAVSDIGIMEKLATQDFLARNMLLHRTQDIDFHPFEEFGIDLPEIISSVKNIDGKRFGIERELKRLWLLEEKTINSLSLVYPEIDFFFDLARCAGIGYYDGFCIKITAENRKGKRYPLIDGGASDWIKKLASNKKEQLFVSGMGTELFARFF